MIRLADSGTLKRVSVRLAAYRPGMRAGVGFGAAAFVVGLSFGVVAQPTMGSIAPIVMSVFVFAGSAQFGATAVLASGGDAVTAIATGVMLNARFLAMGLAAAPALRGGPLRRALEGQAVVDASWALAARGEGGFDRLLVHFDVDVIDFNDAQLSEDAVRGDGLTLDAAMRALGVLCGSERLSALTVTELNPLHGDEQGEQVRRFVDRLADALTA